VRLAEDAGLTLIANARGDGFDVFARPDRLQPETAAHVA
jgi:FdhD protein